MREKLRKQIAETEEALRTAHLRYAEGGGSESFELPDCGAPLPKKR